jgi:hypothetical protein
MTLATYVQPHLTSCAYVPLCFEVFAIEDCTDMGSISLKPPTGDTDTQWTFNTDGSIESNLCPGSVIDVDSGSIVLKSNNSSDASQQWRKVSARLLEEGEADFVQSWSVKFVEDYDDSLSSLSTSDSPTCFEPNAGFSAAFEDFAKDLVIDDTSDESQCEDTREQLGYER